MKNWLIQIVIILVVSTMAALALNTARSGGVSLIGNWPSRTASAEEPIAPPSAMEGDPPFVNLDDAVAKYQSPDVIFIDARDPEDYNHGRVKKSINVPFDYLDETWDHYIATLDKSRAYVIYCSGTECESSLFLGRYLTELGFANIYIFYGGWQEWLDNGMPIGGKIAEEDDNG